LKLKYLLQMSLIIWTWRGDDNVISYTLSFYLK
jgi:hypothetical protein